MNQTPDGLLTIDQIIEKASISLDAEVLHWATAGAGEGVTVTNNREAIGAFSLVPSVGRDVSEVDPSTVLTNVPMALPVFLAPVGALGIYDEEDALGAAKAAVTFSTSAFCAILTRSEWKAVSDTAPGRHFFQLYACGDRNWVDGVVADAVDAGFAGICLTMDSAALARRDRTIEEGFIWQSAPEQTPNLKGRGWDPSFRAKYTWADLEWLCARSPLPVIAKGIMTPEDARKAVECGAAAIYVSNHGGRMVDHAISTIEVLPEIVGAVPETDVVVDGGFTRGAEVVIALALGAKAVGIGRLQCFGLAAGGVDGLVATLKILEQEIVDTMANIGCRSLKELAPEHVRRLATSQIPNRGAPVVDSLKKE
jgi:4-hydroxymandelate oxidase